MVKIVLLCSSGMSTSILVQKMKKAAEKIGFETDISAHSITEAKEVGSQADIVLLGPQVRFNLSAVQTDLPEVPVEVIDMRAYGTMDGPAVIKMVKEVLKDKEK